MIGFWVKIASVFMFLFSGAHALQAGGGKKKPLEPKNVYVVYASNLIYEDGRVIPGIEAAGVARELLQEQGYIVIQPGGSPLIHLTIQGYRSLEPTRYAYLDTVDRFDPMVATNGLDSYYLGGHTFRWLVAPIEDLGQFQNFGFTDERVIFYDSDQGETIESAVHRLIRRNNPLRPIGDEGWDSFIQNLPGRLEESDLSQQLNFDSDRFEEAEAFEVTLRTVYEPIITALTQRRTGEALVFPSEAMTRESFIQYRVLLEAFQLYLTNFASSLGAQDWVRFWEANTSFWHSRLELYQRYLGNTVVALARQQFTHFIRESAIVLIAQLGELQEANGFSDLNNLIFRRIDLNFGVQGWGDLMDRAFALDSPYYPEGLVAQVNTTQTTEQEIQNNHNLEDTHDDQVVLHVGMNRACQ